MVVCTEVIQMKMSGYGGSKRGHQKFMGWMQAYGRGTGVRDKTGRTIWFSHGNAPEDAKLVSRSKRKKNTTKANAVAVKKTAKSKKAVKPSKAKAGAKTKEELSDTDEAAVEVKRPPRQTSTAVRKSTPVKRNTKKELATVVIPEAVSDSVAAVAEAVEATTTPTRTRASKRSGGAKQTANVVAPVTVRASARKRKYVSDSTTVIGDADSGDFAAPTTRVSSRKATPRSVATSATVVYL
eukprot:TRINITY_DN2060_c0_g1_i1.p2 TRINITY_DN2060_c0_g1~~TRINITY_DN2060_c0_g1_i1.p2  ORF type:complete len:239 (-),score=47.33 TRINITY_DN2060_c0_g1_i1:181-897(-)